MKTTTPIALLPVWRQIDWFAWSMYWLYAGLLISLCLVTRGTHPVAFMVLLGLGAGSFLGCSVVAQFRLTAHHRDGVRHMKKRRFSAAIASFERSLAFFDAHPWIDRFRGFLLMMPLRPRYREMALVFAGICHLQLGDRDRARERYLACLERFPSSPLAKAALQAMDPS